MNASGQIEFGLEFARRFREDGYVCIPDFIGADTIAAVIGDGSQAVGTSAARSPSSRSGSNSRG